MNAADVQGGRPPPVIAIDGPAASGKGTVAHGVAQALSYHYLDSGALYRLVALQALSQGFRSRPSPSWRGSPKDSTPSSTRGGSSSAAPT